MNQEHDLQQTESGRLAVFEIDAKQWPATQANWPAAKLLLEAADLVEEIFAQQRGPDPKAPRKGFYPPDLTREDFETWIHANPHLRSAFESPFTAITRENSHLGAVPYHVAYEPLVKQLSGLLSDAARLESNQKFREFLSQRAQDLLTDDYYQSETLWVGLDEHPLDFTVGPYEVYQDEFLGLKASYEAVLFELEHEASARFQQAQHQLVPLCKDVERELGREINIQDSRVRLSIANLVYASGEARAGVPAIAFSLPNDERVIEEVGSRQVILKNVIEAKFNLVAKNLANELLLAPVEEDISFRNFFEHTVFHEIAHSLGPQRIAVNGETSTVNRSLKQFHSVLEEAKADALGACLALTAGQNVDPRLFMNSFVGNFVRSIRFGLDQAHGGANAIQFNYLLQHKAFRIEENSGKLSVDEARTREAVYKLSATILDIQERGDFTAARQFVKTFSVTTPELAKLLKRVEDLPVDILIRYLNWAD